MTEKALRLKNDNSKSQGFKLKSWLPVIVMIIVAILIRLYITSDKNHYLLAGSDGPYFALQVKSLIKNFHLGYTDMPLLFLLGAIIAKLLLLFRIASENECILMSVRFIDAFLPPLVAIPVFLIAKEIEINSDKLKLSSYLMVGFSILSFTPLVIFSYQLQKNALAIIFVFLFIYFVIRILKYGNRRDFYKAVIILLLCTLTHFGSFGLLIFISFLILTFWLLLNRKGITLQLLKNIGVVTIVLLSLVSLIAIFDFTRFQRLIYVPLKIFEAPALLFALDGQNFLLNGRTLITLIISNLLAIQALVIIIRNKKNLDYHLVILGFALVICTLLLATPMLGLEWANRLFMMAYIPITVLYLIIFSSISIKWITIPSMIILSILIVHSICYSILFNPVISITDLAYTEFKQIKAKVHFGENDVIVGRQDLRLLGSWVYGTKGISDYLLTKNEYNKFSAVYIVRQIQGKSPGLRGTEITIPKNTYKVFQGNFFNVYKFKDNTGLKIEKDKIFKGVQGNIAAIDKDKILVKDSKTGVIRTVCILKNTKYNLLNVNDKLSIGMNVEINGEWKPFSLAIDAVIVNEIGNLD